MLARFESWTELSNEYSVFRREQNPFTAGQGDAEATQRWPDNSPAAVERRRLALERFRARLQSVVPESLAPEDAISRSVMERQIVMALEAIAFDEERIPFQNRGGFYSQPESQAAVTVLRSEAQAQIWLARLASLPDFFESETANLRRGIKTRFTQPAPIVRTAIKTLRTLAAESPARSALLAPFDTLPGSMPEAHRAALRRDGETLVASKVRPAQTKLADFLQREYVPNARPELRVTSLDDGERYYAFTVRRHTTTDLTPAAIYRVGQAEVSRIRGEMEAAMFETGFAGDLKTFLTSLASDARFNASTPETYTEAARATAKRIDYLLPRYFGRLPHLTYGVGPKPDDGDDLYGGYRRGSPEMGVAGLVYYPAARRGPLHSLTAWLLHEGVPGHHLQIALQQENARIPEYRRDQGITVFAEGWGLYAEKLGEEMGVYRDAYERVGRLSMEMWRACRLVMDTGLHAQGWNRDQAAQCLKDNTAMSTDAIYGEVDRYIGNPGQALSYKIGELRFVAMRARAEATLGERFDLRAFHDLVLGEGSLPLDLLETIVDRWIAAGGAASKGTSPGG